MNSLAPVRGPSRGADTLELMVSQIRFEAVGVNSYELVDSSHRLLPEMTAGAHIDVQLPDGTVRQYSLCNNPAERDRYLIAVLRDEAGRGGSKRLHDTLRVGDRVKVSFPRNNFHLDETASRYILLAGGIGVTPLKAMFHRLNTLGADYDLHYCSKTLEHAAFCRDLFSQALPGSVHFHHDHGDPVRRLNIKELLGDHEPGAQVYYCGPPGFMDDCARAFEHWPAGSVHFERFKAPVCEMRDPSPAGSPPDEFDVVLASSGQRVHVSTGQSIVEALAEAGIEVETSCVSGLCGTCRVRYLAGEPDHRDFILSDEEKAQYLTACVSRCREGPLVLDL